MIYEDKRIPLKNGLSCLLRSPTAEDAEGMLRYLRQSSEETDFMARYSDEVTTTLEDERLILSDILSDPKKIMIAAFIDGQLVANIGLSKMGLHERESHRAAFGMSIIKAYWGIGLGSVLLSALLESAEIMGYEQLELEVVAENARALALYGKFGFLRFGTRPDTFKYRDGRYCSCHLMFKKV